MIKIDPYWLDELKRQARDNKPVKFNEGGQEIKFTGFDSSKK